MWMYGTCATVCIEPASSQERGSPGPFCCFQCPFPHRLEDESCPRPPGKLGRESPSSQESPLLEKPSIPDHPFLEFLVHIGSLSLFPNSGHSELPPWALMNSLRLICTVMRTGICPSLSQEATVRTPLHHPIKMTY